MWKIGALAGVVALLLIFLGLELWPSGQRPEVQPSAKVAVQPLSRTAVRRCERKLVNDWIDDAVIEGQYRRACYRAALAWIFGGDMSCRDFYGGSLCDDLKAGLRTSS